MTTHVTSFFATPPDASITQVAEKLNERVGELLKQGYVLHSVVAHQGIVAKEGHESAVPCTIGYMIIAMLPNTDPQLVIGV